MRARKRHSNVRVCVCVCVFVCLTRKSAKRPLASDGLETLTPKTETRRAQFENSAARRHQGHQLIVVVKGDQSWQKTFT